MKIKNFENYKWGPQIAMEAVPRGIATAARVDVVALFEARGPERVRRLPYLRDDTGVSVSNCKRLCGNVLILYCTSYSVFWKA